MADNTRLNPGSSGDLISTDSLGGSPEVKVQNVKAQYGASGTATDITSSAPLPVRDYSPGFTVFVGTNLNNDNNVHDINDALSANSTRLVFYVTAVTGGGALTMEILQTDGGSYSTAFDVTEFYASAGEVGPLVLEGVSADSVRITETGSQNMSYVLLAW